ncbi:peptidoglycan-binding protein [Streptomyces mutabilis]|uniref:peptidoglycan-binding protein n=1 Tax=Streptomyces mutabilis TaxID=67332 RepID=UPI0022BA65A0|nr:peptidoglycan-binding protein [Streptomyces mutabilis]MCZ9348535.1 peptidoglycan-binding protein [Streptomyces mutabilis]
MSVTIVSRAQWGARPWNDNPRSSGPAHVPLSKRTEFFVHWFGGVPAHASGAALAREVERLHMDGNGWAGVGYNWVIGEDGTAYEGRGWDRQGAHCPGHNTSGLAVLIAVGKGGKKASKAALATARALYDEACDRTGRTLAQRGHRDGIATECPGPDLYAWVKAGMPAEGYTPPKGGTAPADDDRPSVARYRVTIRGLEYGYGARGDHVTEVGKALVRSGFGRHYKSGPGPEWTDADTENFSDFQVSLGFTGTTPGGNADGVPGETSLRRLLGTIPSKTTPAPAFPGRDKFGPGKSNKYIEQLGRQLVKKGFGDHYSVGPGPKWSDADRQCVEAFQRSQGWTGSDADGYPGPETWRRLFA